MNIQIYLKNQNSAKGQQQGEPQEGGGNKEGICEDQPTKAKKS